MTRMLIIRALGVLYAALLFALLLGLWFFGDAMRGNGAVSWGAFFGDVNGALGLFGLSLGPIETTDAMRAFRLPAALYELHIPIIVGLGVLGLTLADRLWRRLTGRIDP